MNSFSVDETAVVMMIPFCLLCYGLYRYFKTYPHPHIGVGSLEAFTGDFRSIKERLWNLPELLKFVGFLALLLAFIDPKIYFDRGKENQQFNSRLGEFASEGIAIYLVLDQSGSMTEEITTRLPDGLLARISKIDLLKQATLSFINGDPSAGLPGRSNDLIGLVEFARVATVKVPLTLERKPLIKAIDQFHAVQDPSQDGTAIGYALLKTGHLIEATRKYSQDLLGKGKPAYEIKNSIIILVTDGLQDPNPADKNSRWRQIDPIEAANYLKEQGIRLYIVNIEPGLTAEEFAPNRRQLQKAAEATGGKLYMMGTTSSLGEVYASIDAIEKSPIPFDEKLVEELRQKLSKDKLPGLYRTIALAPYLIAIAIACLLLAIVLESSLLRRAS